jgi:hypothetical protein
LGSRHYSRSCRVSSARLYKLVLLELRLLISPLRFSCIRLALQEAYRLRRAKSQPSQNDYDPSNPSSSLPASNSFNPSSYSIEGLEFGSFDEQLRSAMTFNRTSSPASSLSEDEIDLWQAVDTEVLRILEDILEGAGEEGMDAVLGDGNIMVETMDCAKIWIEKYR